MIVRALRLAIVALALLAAFAPLPRWAVERWYSSGLYPGLQAHITPLTNLIPVALLDVGVVLLIMAGLWRFGRVRRRSGFSGGSSGGGFGGGGGGGF